LVVVLGPDSQRLLVEPPGLGVSFVSSLDDHVFVVNQVKVSMFSELRDDVEWSFDVQTKLFIELSLNWFSWVFISIDDIPLLVETTMLVPDDNVSAFSILSTMNIKDFSTFIHNESTLLSPELPPS